MTGPQAAAEFPAARSGHERPLLPAPLSARGVYLRAARAEDLPWLRELYASTRAEELATVPWPEATKRSFLDQQFELQHRHFVGHYPDAEFWLVETAEGPIGRLYRRCADFQSAMRDDLIIDICFLPHWRSQGLGSLLLSTAQREAAARGCGIRLHVLVYNERALRLYQRLGFRSIEATGSHIEMRWAPADLS